MKRSALGSAFVLIVAVASYAGCTQNFDQFTSGSGGSTSASTGANMGGSGGGGGKCKTARDCPVATKECEIAACHAGACGFDDASDGDACNAGHVCLSGACVDCIHDNDCGTQSNDCKTFTCTPANKCQLGDFNDGHPCGTSGKTACKNGKCQGCAMAIDCGMDTECVSFTCTTGSCSSMNLMEGQPTSDQTAGDCMQNVCQGGVENPIVDPTDTPADDGNPCTDEVCQGGTPKHQNKNMNDSCGGNNVCDGSDPPVCVGCTPTSTNCAGAEVCFNQSCCTRATEAAACAGKCTGMVSDTCGGMIACDLNACGVPANFECNGGTCCSKPTIQALCVNQCAGNKTDACGVSRNCSGNTCTSPATCDMTTNMCCTAISKAAACGTHCDGRSASNGCDVNYTCDATVCTGSMVCNGGTCCTPKSKIVACAGKCDGSMASDGCGGMVTCDTGACPGGMMCMNGMTCG